MMSWLDIFRSRRVQDNSASQAKERLTMVISHQRFDRRGDDFLPKLQQELVMVVARYVAIDPGRVNVSVDRGGDMSTLAIEIELPGPNGTTTTIRSGQAA